MTNAPRLLKSLLTAAILLIAPEPAQSELTINAKCYD